MSRSQILNELFDLVEGIFLTSDFDDDDDVNIILSSLLNLRVCSKRINNEIGGVSFHIFEGGIDNE